MTRLEIRDNGWAAMARRLCAAAFALAATAAVGAGVALAGEPSSPAAPNACPGEYEPNDSFGAALPFPMITGALNLAICPVGDEDWFSVPMQVGEAFRIETYDVQKIDVSLDTRLHVYLPDGTTQVAENDDRGGALESASSVITYTPMSAGTYFVRARHFNNTVGGENRQYTLRVTNLCNEIYEPDNTFAQATPLALGHVTMRTLCTLADEDWARVSLVGGTNYRFETIGSMFGLDTVLNLYGTDGTTLLKSDDDSGIGAASFMTYTPPATGDYFLRTKAFGAGSTGFGKHYQLLAIASASSSVTIDSPCAETQLDAAMALSRPGYSIAFNCGTGPGISPFIFPFGAQKNLTPTLTFDGGGAVAFSGLRTNRLFWQLAGASATFRNIQLMRGGGRLAPGGAENAGGAILAYGSLTFENAELSRNTVNTAIYGGGAIYSNGLVTITNSALNFNTSGGGGALYLDSAARTVVQSSQFISNTSYGLYGGGITNVGLLTMTGSLMQSNELSRTTLPAGDEGGGAIANYMAGTVALVNTSLTANYSANRGGGVLNFGRLAMTGGEVSDNRAFDGGGVYNTARNTGGVLVYPGKLTIDSVSFLRNATHSGGAGGGILQYGSATLRLARFDGNTTEDIGGAILSVGPTHVEDGWFARNTAAHNGGAIDIFQDPVWMTNTTFLSNTAAINGGAVHVDGFGGNTKLYATGTRFDRNAAASGGAISALGPADVRSSTFVRNTATSGGAIASGGGGNAPELTVARTLFEQNSAATQAGAVYVGGGRTWMTNTTMSRNQAPNGGALYGFGGTVTLLNVSAVDNGANGLYGAGSSIAITNTLLSRDLAVAGANCAGASLIRAYNSISNDITCQLTTVTPAGNNADSNASLFLGPLAWNGGMSKTYLPGVGSSAIDRSPVGPADDQRGATRAFGAGYDVGAVEVGPTVPNVMPLNVFVPSTAREGASAW